MKNKTLLTILAATLLLLATSCKVEVENVTLNKAVLTLTVGASETLTATVTPAKAEHGALTWTSSNPAVATVDPAGKVTAVANGTATIMVAVAGKTATCTVTVSQDPPPPPRIERWLWVGSWDYRCGSSGFTQFSGNQGVTTDLTDTTMSGIYVNWTEGTYLSRGILRPDGTPYPDEIREGKIIYESNDHNPALFPTIEFENGIRPERTINKWEISYFGDFTSVPSRPYNGAPFYVNNFNAPNQFVVLYTNEYDGNHELKLYFIWYNYPY